MKLDLALSTYSSIDKVLALRCSISARIRFLTNYFINSTHSNPAFSLALREECDFLQSLINRLDINSVICNGYDDVRRIWSTFPKREEHCIRLFGDFTPRRYNSRLILDSMKVQLADASRLLLEGVGSPEQVDSLRRRVDSESFACDLADSVLDSMKSNSSLGRRSELVRRLSLEVESRFYEGWFFIFNTLTVDQFSMDVVFPAKGVKSSAWTDYIRLCDRFFGVAAFGSVRAATAARARGDEFHTYFSVVEQGSETGRLHIHVLHAFKSLPDNFLDPNLFLTVPKNREIEAMRFYRKPVARCTVDCSHDVVRGCCMVMTKVWPFGNVSPVAVRFSSVDGYARAGWRWPVKGKDGVYFDLPTKPPCAIVSYMSKYLAKEILDKEPGCIWRTRLSRRLGSQPILKSLDLMSVKHRLTLLSIPRLQQRLLSVKLPRQLLKRLVLRSLPRPIFLALVRRAMLSPPISIFFL